MQIVCELCGHQGPAASIDVVGAEVRLTCSACGHVSGIGEEAASTETPAPHKRTSGAAANLPPNKCPKCGHRQHDAVACHKCGLVFARVRGKGDRPWEADPPGKEEVVARAKFLWTTVESEPNDANHQAFVDHVRRTGISAWAAMRYRRWIADRPGDELATKHMNVVVADAQAIASALGSTADARSYAENAKRVRVILLAVVILMCVGIVTIGVRLMGARSVAPF